MMNQAREISEVSHPSNQLMTSLATTRTLRLLHRLSSRWLSVHRLSFRWLSVNRMVHVGIMKDENIRREDTLGHGAVEQEEHDTEDRVEDPWTPFSCSQLRLYLFDQLKGSSVITSWSDFTRLEKDLTIPPRFTTVRINPLRIDADEAIEMLKSSIKLRETNNVKIYQHPQLDDLIVIDVQKDGSQSKVVNRGKEVIVDRKCAAAVLRGANIYCGGVIGCPSHLKPGDEVTVYADLDRKCLKGWTKKFTHPKMMIATGKSMVSRNELFCPPVSDGMAVEVTNLNVPMPASVKISSDFYPQNLPSVVAVHVLDPQPGDTVLDMCAAPGGKTTHIASRMKNEGVVIALERQVKRLEKMKENLNLWGMSCVIPFKFNAVKAHDPRLPREPRLDPPFPSEHFDRVMVDAPCSGMGNRPKLKSEFLVAHIENYPETQKEILSTGIRLLRVGGTLVYSTCSFTIIENEAVVHRILQEYPNVRLDVQVPHIGMTGFPGDHGLNNDQLHLLQRFLPDTGSADPNRDTIGFFIAKFVKIKH